MKPGGTTNDMMKTPSEIGSETIQKVIAINRDTIRYCEAELATAVLDGSPFLLVITEQGVDRIYGEWEQAGGVIKVKGYLGIHAVQDHLCGAFLYSPDRGAKAVAALRRMHAELNPRLMHRRQFISVRLTLAKATVAQCEKYLAEAPSDLLDEVLNAPAPEGPQIPTPGIAWPSRAMRN